MSELDIMIDCYEKACDGLEKQNKTLRDERDRLRRALEDIRDSIGNGALNVNWIKQYAEAALTPARGGQDDRITKV